MIAVQPNNKMVGWTIAAVVIFILIVQTFFTVKQTEQVIVLQFGKPVRVIQNPGLKMKLPVIQDVRRFDKRILNVDLPPARVNLSSGQRQSVNKNKDDAAFIMDTGGEPVIIDTFARVRIIDPLLFYQRLDTERNANQRIQSLMNSAMRDVLGQRSLLDILSPVRQNIMEQIRDRLNSEMKARGMEVVDVRIIRADLTDRMQSSTINRMITERRELATDIRAKGQEKAAEIKADADRQRTIILANANKNAQILRGEADKTAIRTYTTSMNKDPSFYAFMRSLDAYKAVFEGANTQFVLSPESGFLRYMQQPQ